MIASPDAVHAEQLMLGLKAGKPILCGKPLATSKSEAKAVLDAKVALGRRIIQVGFMRRFDPGYVQLKQEYTVDRIGGTLIVHNIHRNTHAAYGLVTEQTMTNMVIHELDINPLAPRRGLRLGDGVGRHARAADTGGGVRPPAGGPAAGQRCTHRGRGVRKQPVRL
jgi:hypothetical protein